METQRSVTNSAKNSSELPRSFWLIITMSDAAHASSTGPRCLGSGSGDRPDASAAHREELALLHEVGREEEGQEDLGELAGLEVDRADAHPDAGAEVLPADAGHEREQQKGEAEEPDGPAVALEVADPANQHAA